MIRKFWVWMGAVGLAGLVLASGGVTGAYAAGEAGPVCAPSGAGAEAEQACREREAEPPPPPGLEDVHLPDLVTLPPHELELIIRGDGARLLRFSNSVMNRGPGVLELTGRFDARNGVVRVKQNLYGPDELVIPLSMGELFYHDPHFHWHWDGFSAYEIRALEADGRPGDQVAVSGKVSYCMLDIRRTAYDAPGVEESRSGVYGTCGWRRQGISVGWADVYARHIPGQTLDVSHLADGLYALISHADPHGRLYEADVENNTARVYFLLQGEELRVIGASLAAFLPQGMIRAE